MRLSTSLVAVKKITSTIPRSEFLDNELEQAARLILEAEGVVKPLVLLRTSLESYEIVAGDFEYYAAARAREINPLKGEMIGAFIIAPENEDAIRQQVELLRKREAVGSKVKVEPTQGLINSASQLSVEKPSLPGEAKQIEALFQRIEQLFQEKVETLTDKVNQVDESVRRIKDIVSKQSSKQTEVIHHEISTTGLQSPNYASMTVPQLKKISKQRGLKNTSKMKKAQLIAALTSIQEA